MAVPTAVLDRVRRVGGTVDVGIEARTEAGRDWWPLAIGWAASGQVPARPAAVVRPSSGDQVAELLAACAEERVPVTPMGGRSGVCGGTVPVYGGVALDCTTLVGEIRLDETSLVADVPAGTNGRDLEDTLRATGEGYTLGHWPQSIDLSTVGGWLACRGAGQYSTRYGKIEDMVAGLEVALAGGRLVRTGARGPRAATGPDLTQLFTGSEGVLGVITRAWLRVHPLPSVSDRRAYSFATFEEGLDACRRVLRRGGTPAVLRLYDPAESERIYAHPGRAVLVVLDEADPTLLAATLSLVDGECGRADRLDDGVVTHWLATRNDVSALAPLWRAGIVVDTAEVAGRWATLPELAREVIGALRSLDGTIAASAHLSHAYLDGACLYFTFAGRPPGGRTEPSPPSGRGGRPGSMAAASPDALSAEAYYRRAWDALTGVVTARGAAISHHHGIGLNRGRFLAPALGGAHDVLVSLKRALDPAGILNPGKLGIPSPFGEVPWP
ncbi:MAG TPA: FAD-binding oxidoreductase [Acidimicrobiales bacterium]|nr:FAD-binding oxidoreductase [Acidimicrobiales bacterium]